MTHELPPQQVGHGEEGDGSASGHLDMRMDLTEAGLAALNRRLEVVEGNFSSLESTALEELGDVKEALDLLTEEHKEGLTDLELKLTEAVSALHGEVESLKQQLEEAKLAGGTGAVTVGHGEEGDGSASGHLDMRMDLTEAGLAALNRRLEVVEGNFSSLDSAALEELGDVKEALDLLTEEHKEGLTDLELKLTKAVSALHGEVESLKQYNNEKKKANGPRNGCYLCKDPSHGYKDCPSLGKLSALITAERRQTCGATQVGAQAGEGAAQERQDVAHLGYIMLGALLTKEPALEQVVRDKPDLAQMGQTSLGAVMSKEPRLKQKGSLFVDAKINGQSIRIMVDTGATHDFVTEAKAKTLGLTFGPSSSLLKTVNADLTSMNGVARNVQLRSLAGECEFLCLSHGRV
ncbi:hypothetical protein A4A49_07826 [Nicotiana attenuata]|uniref:Uncharacterized protein n=1 Tax=Nicotiana attenuata TaxID=49451 RepID=A0A1J6IUM5_NICAT|nr:hypothetical protein A4A49_07826 [Nicotiana attenuata]